MIKMFADTETTGLFNTKHAIIQLAYVIDLPDGTTVERNLLLRPPLDAWIDPKALAVNKRTPQELTGFPPSSEAFNTFYSDVTQAINLNEGEKLCMFAYNAPFDEGFLREWCKRHGSWKTFGELFQVPVQCVMQQAALWYQQDAEKLARRKALENFKLATVYRDIVGGSTDWHDALADVKATRDLHYAMLAAAGDKEPHFCADCAVMNAERKHT